MDRRFVRRWRRSLAGAPGGMSLALPDLLLGLLADARPRPGSPEAVGTDGHRRRSRFARASSSACRSLRRPCSSPIPRSPTSRPSRPASSTCSVGAAIGPACSGRRERSDPAAHPRHRRARPDRSARGHRSAGPEQSRPRQLDRWQRRARGTVEDRSRRSSCATSESVSSAGRGAALPRPGTASTRYISGPGVAEV